MLCPECQGEVKHGQCDCGWKEPPTQESVLEVIRHFNPIQERAHLIAEAMFGCDADEAHFEFPEISPDQEDLEDEVVQVSWYEFDYDGTRDYEYRSFSVELLWDDDWMAQVVKDREDQVRAARLAAHEKEIKEAEAAVKRAGQQAATAQRYADERVSQAEDRLLKLLEKEVS